MHDDFFWPIALGVVGVHTLGLGLIIGQLRARTIRDRWDAQRLELARRRLDEPMSRPKRQWATAYLRTQEDLRYATVRIASYVTGGAALIILALVLALRLAM